MSEHTTAMKRPFRVTENREFCDCYGAACMAYYEVPYIRRQDVEKAPKNMCRRMLATVPCGCA